MKRIMTFNRMMGNSYSLFQNSFFPLFGYSLVSGFLLLMCMGFLTFPISLVILLLSAISGSDGFMNASGIGITVAAFLVGLLVAVLSLCLYKTQSCGFYKLVEQDMHGKKGGFGDMFVFPFQRLFPILTVGFALFFYYVVPVAAFTTLFLLLARWTEGTFSLRLTAFTAAGLLAAACFTFLAIRSLFAFPVGALEKKYFFRALFRSFHLSKGVFWKLFVGQIGNLVSYAGLYLSISTLAVLVQIVLAVLPGFGTGDDAMSMRVLVQIILAAFQVMLTSAILPVPALFTACQYYNRRFELEGYDLALEQRDEGDRQAGVQPESAAAGGLPHWASPPPGIQAYPPSGTKKEPSLVENGLPPEGKDGEG